MEAIDIKVITVLFMYPVDTERKPNVHKTFRRRPGRLMYVQFTSSALHVRTNKLKLSHFNF